MAYSKISLVDGIIIDGSDGEKKVIASKVVVAPTDQAEANIKTEIETVFGEVKSDIHIHITRGPADLDDNGEYPAGALFVRTGVNNGVWPDTETDPEAV